MAKRQIKTVTKIVKVVETPTLLKKVLVSLVAFTLGFGAVLLGKLAGKAEATLDLSQQVVLVSQHTSKALSSGFEYGRKVGYRTGHAQASAKVRKEIRKRR